MAILQRVLPDYRVPFFDTLAGRCSGGMSVFAGDPASSETIAQSGQLRVAVHAGARNVHILRGRFYACWQGGIKSWLDEWSPDALVVAADTRLLSTRVAVRWARVQEIPVLGWGLGVLHAEGGPISAFRNRFRTRFLRSLDGVIAYSSKAADDYRRAGVSEDRIFVAPNAVSTDTERVGVIARDDQRVENWRREQGLDRPTIITVGRLIPPKRIDVLIEACAALGDRCDLLIVGDGPERPKLEKLSAEIFPRTRFLGYQEGEALAVAFGASEVFALPGTGGLAIHEAMAHAKPVVVGRADGTESDLVKDGSNGTILPSVDPSSLALAIQKYVADTDYARTAGSESRRIATEEVSIERMADTFVEAAQLLRVAR